MEKITEKEVDDDDEEEPAEAKDEDEEGKVEEVSFLVVALYVGVVIDWVIGLPEQHS